VGAPDLKPEKTPEERRGNNIAGSFEAWARSLEAAGLTFDSTSRRWHLLAQSRSPDKALQIEHLELIYRRSQILIERITYKLDLQRWAKMAQNAAKETFGPRTRAELHNNFNQDNPTEPGSSWNSQDQTVARPQWGILTFSTTGISKTDFLH